MRILITGCAGYIGSVLTPMLLEEGHEVRGIEIFMSHQNSLAMCAQYPTFSAYRIDIRDIDALKPHLEWADLIIPLAGLVGAPICDQRPYDAKTTNLHGQLTMLFHIPDSKRIVMPITESVYGSNMETCTEFTPVNPLSSYGKHKVEVEKALLQKKNSTSLRLATVFGFSPCMRIDLMVNDFVWRALNDRAMVIFEGEYRRTSVHVRDVARAFKHVIDNELTGVYNVGQVHCTKLELCAEIKKQVPWFAWSTTTDSPKDRHGHDPDQRNYVVSDQKLRDTGFEYAMDLEQGIAELIRGYKTIKNSVYSYV